MATVAIQPPPRDTPTPPPMPVTTPPGPTLPAPGAASTTAPIPIPNKHVALSGPGAPNYANPVTPPASPHSEESHSSEEESHSMSSLLSPADGYPLISKSPPVRAIDAAGVASSINFSARQTLPDIEQIFPWAHGLHPDNSIQLAFFCARKKSMRRPPTCYRGVCIVKVGDLSCARLKGAVMAEEILPSNPAVPGFLVVDPKDGFNVRNFHIQVGKFACLSDIIVYGDDEADHHEVMRVAKRISAAQIIYRAQYQGCSSRVFPTYSTFVVQGETSQVSFLLGQKLTGLGTFSMFEKFFPEIVTVDSLGNLTGQVIDFCHWERMEMCSMSRATEISRNVWLGSSTDAGQELGQDPPYGLLIEASDLAQMPSAKTLRDLSETLDHSDAVQYLEFPGSGTMTPPKYTTADVDGIIDACRFIQSIANGRQEGAHDADGDVPMTPPREPRRILIHCMDGYTETSLLALAYLMFSEGLPAHAAWIQLHTKKGRNFFAYEKDLQFFRFAERRILEAAADCNGYCLNYGALNSPAWFHRMDGSIPSRILSYMYLGNLQHANNPGLLNAVGIKRVLSIGEELSWTEKERNSWGIQKAMVITDLQDNGCDPLEYQFRRCLDFIDEGRLAEEPILVHCRVGVSRSATICIAEVMRALKLSLPRAYCYVRARRLNVIIQPHLRFMYELLKFEERLPFKNRCSPKRELEWSHIAREIATMNRPYTRQN